MFKIFKQSNGKYSVVIEDVTAVSDFDAYMVIKRDLKKPAAMKLSDKLNKVVREG